MDKHEKDLHEKEPLGPPAPKPDQKSVDPDPTPHPSAPPHTHEQGEDDVHVNPADPDDAGGQ